MRTTDMNGSVAPALLAALALFLCASLPVRCAVPEPAAAKRFFIGAAGGYFRPGQASFRRIYDRPAWPIELQLGWALDRKLTILGGARYLRATGRTVLVQAWLPDEAYAVRLDVLALRFGLNYGLGLGRFAPFFGAGIQYVFYREKWLDVSLEAKGGKTGFFALGGGRWRLGRSLHALLQLEYSNVPAGEGSGVSERANLGGLGLSLGIRAGIL